MLKRGPILSTGFVVVVIVAGCTAAVFERPISGGEPNVHAPRGWKDADTPVMEHLRKALPEGHRLLFAFQPVRDEKSNLMYGFIARLPGGIVPGRLVGSPGELTGEDAVAVKNLLVGAQYSRYYGGVRAYAARYNGRDFVKTVAATSGLGFPVVVACTFDRDRAIVFNVASVSERFTESFEELLQGFSLK